MSNFDPSQINNKLEALITGTTETQRKITSVMENNRTFMTNLAERIRKALELINVLKMLVHLQINNQLFHNYLD